mmetsp:Transcript_64902/g.115490  ORF Transcript_64902/g.115490 Transcript_64902/m.115490 type:complete len:103 (+) Transcript_64902:953-1261(+)
MMPQTTPCHWLMARSSMVLRATAGGRLKVNYPSIEKWHYASGRQRCLSASGTSCLGKVPCWIKCGFRVLGECEMMSFELHPALMPLTLSLLEDYYEASSWLL